MRIQRMRTGISFSLADGDRDRLNALVADRNSPQKQVWRPDRASERRGLGTNAIMAATGCARQGGSSIASVLLEAPRRCWRIWPRYTHRVAIPNRRLLSIDALGVTFKVKDYRVEGPGRYTTMTLATREFIRRS